MIVPYTEIGGKRDDLMIVPYTRTMRRSLRKICMTLRPFRKFAVFLNIGHDKSAML